MRFFNCIGIRHEFIHENGKNKAHTKQGYARLFSTVKLQLHVQNSQSANVYWPSNVKSIVQYTCTLNANHLFIWFKDSLCKYISCSFIGFS